MAVIWQVKSAQTSKEVIMLLRCPGVLLTVDLECQRIKNLLEGVKINELMDQLEDELSGWGIYDCLKVGEK